jgi:hypothetical protein
MNTTYSGGSIQIFRLTNEPGGLGLSCTASGVSLAGVPLLRKSRAGFVPRTESEIGFLLEAAFGEDPTRLQSRLRTIAQALNSGDFAEAMIAAVHTRTPELSPEAAQRLAKADRELAKYNYNPAEPRDWRGHAGPETDRPVQKTYLHLKSKAMRRPSRTHLNSGRVSLRMCQQPRPMLRVSQMVLMAMLPASQYHLSRRSNVNTTTSGPSIFQRKLFSSAIG